MNLWFEKYRPRTLDDIVISDSKRDTLVNWFTKFQIGETAECALLFTGPPGLGKTSLAHILLDTFGYKAKEYNASDIRSKALIKENLYGLINIADVTTVTGKSTRPVGIIMDEVDGMFKGDRGGIEELLSYISIPSNRKLKVKSHNRQVPIICICNIGSVKKEVLKNLNKECFEVTFSLPDKKSLGKVVDRISAGEGLTVTEEAKNAMIEYSQGDYRRLITIMEFLYVTNNSVDGISEIGIEHVEACYDVFSRKEQDLHITDSIKRLINNKLDGHTVHMIYDGDKSKTPMVVHQNYLQAISLQKTPVTSKINNAIDCMDSLIVSDIIEKTMYNTQCWYLQPMQGYTCAMIPNYYINKAPKTSYVTASWASVLSISSQSQNLRKNMYNEIYEVDREHTYSIEDVQTIIEVVFSHLINGDTDRAIHMLLDYNLTELNDCLLPNCKKKSLLIIDKIAKYIKISPYYKQWTKFRDANKGDKDLDQHIKSLVCSYSSGPRITTESTKTKGRSLALKTKKPQTQVQAPVQVQAPAQKLKPVLRPKSQAVPVPQEQLVQQVPSKPKPTIKPKPKSASEQLTLAAQRTIRGQKRP